MTTIKKGGKKALCPKKENIISFSGITQPSFWSQKNLRLGVLNLEFMDP